MYNILYKSSSTNDLDQDDLSQILQVARANNQKLCITGMLLYYEGLFIQLLEGEKEQVEEVFDKISQDSRHCNIELLIGVDASDRYFPNWQMGFKWLDKSDLRRIENHDNADIRNVLKTSQPFKLIKLMSHSHWQQ